MLVRRNVSRSNFSTKQSTDPYLLAFGQPTDTDPSEQSTYYRASPKRILQILRLKVNKLADPQTLASFPSLVKQILRNGLDEEFLDAYKSAMGEEVGDDKVQQRKQDEVIRRQKIADQARTRVACEIVGGYLAPDVHQCLVRSYE